ncbi:MAG: type II toxin-antitoxin system HicB family antitoxin [Candidatus Portnoybacteria bacterium CG03_land_8_20_14_0_80_41_10]|uniref:Type II toxin-antitoxin system HicB family antitoxin n=1 Tax=Candidatus Portnoybacteria bacterium CG03_land_8_20_14_0_80_41_10 TaxID=1974808 RepID=A0A2M7BUS5_9BACT|nr:MAG: type II toxin-antitoxin system HicB family antitoxin [Candidatus Portnoybacteria bacterium CG03_land_8_20_14_0_80_41_10]
MNYHFTAIITKEGKWFVAKCAELGVVSQGKTVEEAQKNLKEATELYLEKEKVPRKSLSKKAPLITTFELKYA